METLGDVVGSVTSWFVRRRAPADADDIRQNAWVAALESLRWWRGEGDVRAYAAMAARRQVSREIGREVSPVTIGSHAALRNVREVAARGELPNRADEATPERSLADAQRDAIVRAELARLLEAHVSDDNRPLVVRLLGLDGEPAETPAQLGRRLSVEVNRLASATKRFRKAASASPLLRELFA